MKSSKKNTILECVNDDEQNKKLDLLTREYDTFWSNDTSKPPCLLGGHNMLRSSMINKSLAFTHQERQVFRIHGLLPYAVRSMEQQVKSCRLYFDSTTSHMQKFLYLTDLEHRNRRLFYRLLLSDVDTFMPILDSSASDFIVKNFSLMHTRPRGLFITIKDRGHVYEVLKNWPCRKVRCLFVTNGAAVLSMGDHGVNSLSVVLSKLQQNVVFGGMHPDFCIPVILDVGTNNEELLQDPFYTGLKERRVSRQEFEEFFEEFMMAVVRVFGSRAVIQCKDFDAYSAIRQTELYRNRQCFLDVDFQCLGACGLAGVMVANRSKRQSFKKNKLMFYGAEAINIGMARLCLANFKREGLDESAARERIWFCDDKGLIVAKRPKHKVPDELLEFVQQHDPIDSLEEAIDLLKPNVLVGGCAQPHTFTKAVLNAMERSAEQPIIYAMSRPLERAECTADEAFVHTKGRCIFISGSTLPPVKYANKWYQPGRCSSIYLLSGVTMGVMLSGMTTVPDEMFCVAAERLASLVWPNDLAMRNVYPPMRKVQCINFQITEAVFTYAYRRRLASLWPEPENPTHYIQSMMYAPEYRKSYVQTYSLTESKKY